MAINKNLKAFVRFDGSGRVVPSSVILQRTKPKVGNWKEIPANLCCNPPAPGDFILLEDSTPGDFNFLLQEDGGRIII